MHLKNIVRGLHEGVSDFAQNTNENAHNMRVCGLIFGTAVGAKFFFGAPWSWGSVLGAAFAGWVYYIFINVFADIFTDKNN
jgi:hypothetical protein